MSNQQSNTPALSDFFDVNGIPIKLGDIVIFVKNDNICNGVVQLGKVCSTCKTLHISTGKYKQILSSGTTTFQVYVVTSLASYFQVKSNLIAMSDDLLKKNKPLVEDLKLAPRISFAEFEARLFARFDKMSQELADTLKAKSAAKYGYAYTSYKCGTIKYNDLTLHISVNSRNSAELCLGSSKRGSNIMELRMSKGGKPEDRRSYPGSRANMIGQDTINITNLFPFLERVANAL